MHAARLGRQIDWRRIPNEGQHCGRHDRFDLFPRSSCGRKQLNYCALAIVFDLVGSRLEAGRGAGTDRVST